jgi:hypothetical protein
MCDPLFDPQAFGVFLHPAALVGHMTEPVNFLCSILQAAESDT